MNKLYSVHDHWTDINKKNDVDIESINGVITGIKVNGEDYGGGTSWTKVFSGNVVTSGEAAPFSGIINAVLSGADTIKVFYNDGVYILPKQVTVDGNFYGATRGANPGEIDFSEIPFLIKLGEIKTGLYTQSPGPQDITILEPQSGGESDLIWILPEQTATLVDQPVEITGLRLDLLPQGVDIMPFKCTSENMGHLHTYYVTLHYDGSALVEDNGTFSIYPKDGSYYFVNADEGTIIEGEYTISIALF